MRRAAPLVVALVAAVACGAGCVALDSAAERILVEASWSLDEGATPLDTLRLQVTDDTGQVFPADPSDPDYWTSTQDLDATGASVAFEIGLDAPEREAEGPFRIVVLGAAAGQIVAAAEVTVPALTGPTVIGLVLQLLEEPYPDPVAGPICDQVVAELCDGVDNDCDGETDEDWPELGEPCDGPDTDLCEEGTWTCDGQAPTCDDDTSDIPEFCNNKDDDCDGETDEDFPELGQPCDGDDADQCLDGIWACADPDIACTDGPTTTSELCNGLDDDCDGQTDECNAACEDAGGLCSDTFQACVDGSCVCVPDCEGKQCGADGCGGSCGSCDGGAACVGGLCYDGPATCVALWLCAEACADGDCPAECEGAAPADAQAAFDALDGCWDDHACNDKRCLADHCAPEVAGCWLPAPGGLEGCQTLAACIPCDHWTGGCDDPCFAQGDEEAQTLYAAGMMCTQDACPEGFADGVCITDALEGDCASYYEACLADVTCIPDCDGKSCGDDGCGEVCGTCDPGDICTSGACTAPPGDCGQLDACTTACAADQDCQTACYDAADAPAQVLFDGIEACAAANACEDDKCLADHCAGSVAACLYPPSAGPATCAELALCMASCADDACRDACAVEATFEAQFLFVAAQLCMDHYCAADSAICRFAAVADADKCLPYAQACSEDIEPCTPSCEGKVCGGDGCGGSCGACGLLEVCASAACVEEPFELCLATGGSWTGCGPGCAAATCAAPADETACAAGCMPKCSCPDETVWDVALGCVGGDTCHEGCFQSCDDGDPCTLDVCDEGECSSTTLSCPNNGPGCLPCPGGWCSQGECIADGAVRLGAPIPGAEVSMGRVDVFHGGRWGPICSEGISVGSAAGKQVARVACRQIGFEWGQSITAWPGGASSQWLDDLDCSGTEEELLACSPDGWGADCGVNASVGVACFATCASDGDCATSDPCATWTCEAGQCLSAPKECAAADVECAACDGGWCHEGQCLADGTPRIGDGGRIEVWHDAQWGTVCDDALPAGTDAAEAFAEVVCRQLGYTGGELLPKDAVPDGTGVTWLDGVSCTGTEASVAECSFPGWGDEDCQHNEDVGVACWTTCGADIDCHDGQPDNADACLPATRLCAE